MNAARQGEGATLNNISQNHSAKGDHDMALQYLQQSLKIRQEIFATVPPTVECTLTDKGRKLEPVIAELYKWGQEFVLGKE